MRKRQEKGKNPANENNMETTTIETGAEFRCIRQANGYEIDKNGNIRRVADKSPVFPLGNKVILLNNMGGRQNFAISELVNEIWNNIPNLPPVKDIPKKKEPKKVTSNNNNLKSKPMVEQTSTVDQAKIEAIKKLTCKKHVKIWKLSQLGLSKKEIAGNVGTNVGAVHNVLKEYNLKPEKVKAANEIKCDN